jgi:hypothetical protein
MEGTIAADPDPDDARADAPTPSFLDRQPAARPSDDVSVEDGSAHCLRTAAGGVVFSPAPSWPQTKGGESEHAVNADCGVCMLGRL